LDAPQSSDKYFYSVKVTRGKNNNGDMIGVFASASIAAATKLPTHIRRAGGTTPPVLLSASFHHSSQRIKRNSELSMRPLIRVFPQPT
jgi:hypothetical protein